MNEEELSHAVTDFAKELREIGTAVARLEETNRWQVDALKDLQAKDEAQRVHCSGQRRAFHEDISALERRVSDNEGHVAGTRRWAMIIGCSLGGLWAIFHAIATWMGGVK